MRRLPGYLRRLRFLVLQHLVLPLAIVPLRWLVRSWRAQGPDANLIAEVKARKPVMLFTCHGMFLHLLAFAQIPPRHGRRLVVMLSPSLDGRLLAAALDYFGIDHVQGTLGSRAVAGSREFIKRVQAGDIGVVAADGPRGPCCVAKAGFLRIAAAANAHLLLAATSARHGLTVPSWDRAHLAAPFSRVEILARLLPPPTAGSEDEMLAQVQAAMLKAARQIASPVLPRELH